MLTNNWPAGVGALGEPVISVAHDYSAPTSYFLASDSDASRGAALAAAVAAAGPGDKIKLGPGTYTVTSVVLADNLDMEGSGNEETIIESSVDAAVIVTPGSNSTISNLKVKGTLDASHFQYPIGCTSATISTVTNVTLINVRTDAYSDGIYWNKTGASMRAFNCLFKGGYDAVNVLRGTGEFYDCVNDVDRGRYRGTPAGTDVRGLATSLSGALHWYGGSIKAAGGTAVNVCLSAAGTSTMEVQNTSITNSTVLSPPYDIDTQAGSPTIRYNNVVNVDGTPLRVHLGSGSPQVIN